MLIFSMTASADGFVMDRDGGIGWTAPTDDLFACHLERVRGVGAHLSGRHLYEAMLPWETDPAMRSSDLYAAFADVWTAIPKVVFSRTLDRVEGNARLAERSLADEVAAAQRRLEGTGRDVEIGGADLAGQAVALGLVEEFQLFRAPVVVGGGTPFFPPDVALELDLVQTRTFENGTVLERYRPTTSR